MVFEHRAKGRRLVGLLETTASFFLFFASIMTLALLFNLQLIKQHLLHPWAKHWVNGNEYLLSSRTKAWDQGTHPLIKGLDKYVAR